MLVVYSCYLFVYNCCLFFLFVSHCLLLFGCLLLLFIVVVTSDLDNKPKKVYWDEISLDFNVKEKVEPGVPFILMGKKIFDCHHGKDRSVAMKKRAELRRIEVCTCSL
jgi:hypothetical protein